MKYNMTMMIAVVLSFICLEVTGQAPFDSVRICAVTCSDGSTITQCCDLFGAPSSGDCSWASLACPDPLSTINKYDFGARSGLGFTNSADCQRVLDNIKKRSNKPKIVDDNVTIDVTTRSLSRREQALKKAMEWHDDFSLYSPEEQFILGKRIIEGNRNKRSVSYSEEQVRDIARAMYSFVKRVKENTNKTGVYTNSKCAGCSLIVQSIEEKLSDSMCGYLSDTLRSVVCDSNPVLDMFCSSLFDEPLNAVQEMIEEICHSAIDGFAEVSGIRDRANYLCSTLTCTKPPSEITTEDDITGSCGSVKVGSDDKSLRELNERCDELIRICDMAEKGFCIAETIKEIKDETSGGFVDASLKTLQSIACGETPPVAESVQKLASECSKVKCGGIVSSASKSNPLASVGLVAVLLSIISRL